MRYLKIVGIILENIVMGIMEVVDFVGVICVIILVINLILMIIFKLLIVFKIRNLIVFVFYLNV